MRKTSAYTLLLSIGIWLAPNIASAQKKKQAPADPPASTIDEPRPAQKMIEEYRFEEAISLLEKEMDTAKRQKKPTTQIEADMQIAQKGANMLAGTEKVTFIDSIVVDKDKFLNYYRLSNESGHIKNPKEILPKEFISTFKAQEIAYINELEDKILFPAPAGNNGVLKIFSSSRLSDSWNSPQQLQGMSDDENEVQNYPFVLSDGVTLYYAAQGSESLGGYDIFVTRYNSETKSYVKAENIGMPFNSPANDYLLAIDETTGIGWFVSDRSQPADKVCLYLFIPNEIREIYDPVKTGEERLRRMARISSIAESQPADRKKVEEARLRLSKLKTRTHSIDNEGKNIQFIINDKIVYSDLTQFRNPQARRIAEEWWKATQMLQAKEEKLRQLRLQYSKSHTVPDRDILALEKETDQLLQTVNKLAKSMRKTELQ